MTDPKELSQEPSRKELEYWATTFGDEEPQTDNLRTHKRYAQYALKLLRERESQGMELRRIREAISTVLTQPTGGRRNFPGADLLDAALSRPPSHYEELARALVKMYEYVDAISDRKVVRKDGGEFACDLEDGETLLGLFFDLQLHAASVRRLMGREG